MINAATESRSRSTADWFVSILSKSYDPFTVDVIRRCRPSMDSEIHSRAIGCSYDRLPRDLALPLLSVHIRRLVNSVDVANRQGSAKVRQLGPCDRRIRTQPTLEPVE